MIKLERLDKKLKVAATYISTDVACSIIGDGRLNFQVRNGAGCDPPSSPTTKRSKNTLMCLILFALESLSKLSIVKSLDNVDYNCILIIKFALNKVVPIGRIK